MQGLHALRDLDRDAEGLGDVARRREDARGAHDGGDGDEHVLGEHDAIRIDGGGAIAIVDGTVLLVRVG